MTQTTNAPRAISTVNSDWVRALQRTAPVTLSSPRTLAIAVTEFAATDGARPALVGLETSLTYAELADRADHYARWAYSQGLRKGDQVALMLDNQPDFAAIWIGLSKLGIVTALLNTQLAGEGLGHCLSLAAAQHLIVGAAHLETVASIEFEGTFWVHATDHPIGPRIDTGTYPPVQAQVQVTLADQALLIYTSGTTGLPKAARVSHYRIMMWSEWFAGIMNVGPDDRLYNCLPMYHSVGGVVAVGAMLVAGAAVIVRRGFSARKFWPDVAESQATIFQYIGELCRYLASAPAHESERAHQLRLCVGNGLSADVWDRFAARFAIPRIIEFYAATEGSFSLFNLEGRTGAIGRVPRFMAHLSPVALVAFDHTANMPLRGDDGLCRRCAPGETGEAIGLIARETSGLATRFEGYTNAAETERKILRNVFVRGDTWFRTGDLMRQDKAGFFYFVDRIGDTFRWKGENVAASEVANVVASCPGILDATVYGVAVPGADGRAGMAALVPAPDLDIESLCLHLTKCLPKFARPLFLRLRTSMDMTSTFKTKKNDLVREGFDPSLTSPDGLFVFSDENGTFVPLDADRHAEILSGTMRL